MRCAIGRPGVKAMIDHNQYEVAALESASSQAGSYIESIGKTDLAAFTQSEWSSLIDVVVTAFRDHLSAAYADDPPF